MAKGPFEQPVRESSQVKQQQHFTYLPGVGPFASALRV